MIAFKEAPYRAQVSRLRKLAIKALESYNLKIQKISFIQHGENTTYKITAKSGDLYLLRIHRADYHTQTAIQEELQWLDQLTNEHNLKVPGPIKSKNNKFVEAVFIPEVGEPRFCCMFKWVNGRFIDKHLTPQQSYSLGQFTANLHMFSKNRTAKNRRYWTANGLVGSTPKFGSIDQISVATKAQQKIITKTRLNLFKKLKSYETKFKNKSGLIHADLHFGNLLLQNKKWCAIDFDDCGYGFYMYDLAVSISSINNNFKNKKLQKICRENLIAGYKSIRHMTEDDMKIIEVLIGARKTMMLGWLNARQDNPRLKKYLKKVMTKTVSELKDQKFN